ncbi:hypothetical protein [Halomonas sp. M4R1S46]|uniref:hypothetical protein n=1 Tax=Halomonas sp. M4R1S46 TaxID=2982692 RepID=UPI0021E37622|nr:hypothetical protein [Halomonas sp. M4R1S46]UYG09200.1 hypothetical protein OCT48_07690 [Halomonas sp. M4R1S46]
MPKPPTTITIAPSRLALLAHGLPALGVVALLTHQAPSWVAVSAALVMGAVLWDIARRRPAGALRVTPRPSAAPDWAWRPRGTSDWQAARLDCDYLGPWLVGLRLDGRRLWVWPDSSDAASRRILRRWLVSLP